MRCKSPHAKRSECRYTLRIHLDCAQFILIKIRMRRLFRLLSIPRYLAHWGNIGFNALSTVSPSYDTSARHLVRIEHPPSNSSVGNTASRRFPYGGKSRLRRRMIVSAGAGHMLLRLIDSSIGADRASGWIVIEASREILAS